MAKCLILKSFKGSQDGRFATQFTEGEVEELSDYLMASAVPSDFQRLDTPTTPVQPVQAESGRANVPARPFMTPDVVENKATVTSKSRAEHIPTLGGKK